MTACKLLEAEFKILVKGMFSELRERIDELIEKFRREIWNIKMEIGRMHYRESTTD